MQAARSQSAAGGGDGHHEGAAMVWQADRVLHCHSQGGGQVQGMALPKAGCGCPGGCQWGHPAGGPLPEDQDLPSGGDFQAQPELHLQ